MFPESQWIKLLFMLSDMQTQLRETEKDLFNKVPVSKKKFLFRSSYYITAYALAHILERHYHKIPRHPGVGKFTIPVADILDNLRKASMQTPVSILGSVNFFREFDTGSEIGFDSTGTATNIMTVITTHTGCIKTAFPGNFKNN